MSTDEDTAPVVTERTVVAPPWAAVEPATIDIHQARLLIDRAASRLPEGMPPDQLALVLDAAHRVLSSMAEIVKRAAEDLVEETDATADAEIKVAGGVVLDARQGLDGAVVNLRRVADLMLKFCAFPPPLPQDGE